MSTSRWTLSSETVTAIAAIFTAVVALAVGVWQTAETRRHNRLSVRPLLAVQNSFRIALAPEDQDRVGEVSLEELEQMPPVDTLRTIVSVTNKGLGLADVTDMRITIETLAGGTESFSTWEEARPTLQAFGLRVLSNATLGGRFKIEPGESVNILETDGLATGSLDSLQAVMDRIDIDIDYVSLYQEPFTTHEHDAE